MTKQKSPADKMIDIDKESEGRIFRADTVPPPASGDAYSAATVVREAPPEVLEAIRERKAKAQEASGTRASPARRLTSGGDAPHVAPAPPLQIPRDPNVPRLNVHGEIHGDEELDWDLPPEPPPSFPAAVQRIANPVGPPVEEAEEEDDHAVTMLSVSPRVSRVPDAAAADKVARVADDILGPSTSTPDVLMNPSAWPAPLSPASRFPRWLRFSLGLFAIAVLSALIAAAWDSLQ